MTAPTLTFVVGTTLKHAEEMLILATVSAVNGNKSEAAKILGISRKTLYNKLTELAKEKNGRS